MKKVIISVGVLVVFGLIVFLIQRQNSPIVADVNSPTPAPSTYTVVVIAPTVSIKNSGEADFSVIQDRATVAVGAHIKTSANGQASLLYPNGTKTLIEENSTIEITALDKNGNQSRIKILTGGIWSKVKNILGTNDYYEVETENVVASVRGTMFRTQFKNHITNLFGIEHAVHVRPWDSKTNKAIAGTDIELTSGEKTMISSAALPGAGKALRKELLSDADLRQTLIRNHILELIEKGDLGDKDVRSLIERVRQSNLLDKTFIRRMIERQLIQQTPSVSPRPTTTKTPIPSLSRTPLPSVTPTPIPTTTATPVPDITIDTTPVIISLYPKTISAGSEFTINGSSFTAGRNTPQVTGVMVGNIATPFGIIDSSTIFVTPGSNVGPGTYPVSAMTSSGAKITSPQNITIQ